MAIYKRGNTYWYEFQWKGRRIQESAKTTNKRVAEQIESARKVQLAKIEAGLEDERPAKGAPTFKVAMTEFIDWSKVKHADKRATTRRYEVSGVALREFFRDTQLDRIDKDKVEQFIEWRWKQKKKAPGRLRKKNKTAKTDIQIKPATVNRELACLKAIFNYQQGRGVRLVNPVSEVKYLKEEHDAFHVVTADEEAKYLDEASEFLHDVAVIMLETGMRPDEVYRMERKNVYIGQGFYFNPYGKTKPARRRVPLTDRAKSIINARMKEVEGALLFPSDRMKDETPVLKVNNAHYGALKRCKLRFRLYDLRHTFATRAVEAGVDLMTLAALLGHSRLEMVMRYAHPTQQHQADAIRKMEAYRLRLQAAD